LARESKPKAKLTLSGAERQRRYRLKRAMCSIDITGSTSAFLEILRGETGWSNDRLISEALKALQARVDRSSKARKPSTLRWLTAQEVEHEILVNQAWSSPQKCHPVTGPGWQRREIGQTKKQQKPKTGPRFEADLFGD
jgi:hypothetical protein